MSQRSDAGGDGAAGAMWRVTLYCHQRNRNGIATFFTEGVDVPDNDLQAAAQNGMRKLRELRHDVTVTRIDVKRLEERQPPRQQATQARLW